MRFLLIVSILCIASACFSANTVPPELKGIKIEQRLNASIPLDVKFLDESGRPVTLRQYFHGKPVILSFAYFKCPMLCTYVLRGLTGSLKTLSFSIGKEFEVLTVSFDPSDNPMLARSNKADYLRTYNRPGAESGWHFLTGDQKSIDALTKAAGFHYRWDPRQQQFAHASGIMVLTPQGHLARYFYGIEYAPKDLRLALVEASQNQIGNPVDQLLLFCFHYDPNTGKYNAYAINLVRLGGVLTVCALGIFIFRNARHRT